MEFVCRLGTQDGRVVEQHHQGSDERSLRGELERRGYHVFEVRRAGAMARISLRGRRRPGKPIPTDDFLVFNQELAALLRAGLPLMQALDLMLERMKDQNFRPILQDIRDRVKSGENLSDAFASYGDVFPRLYASTLKAGERSGEMESVIRRFIRYLQLVSGARKKIVTALTYPAVLIGLSLIMLTVMGLYVVPKFTEFYADLNAELPFLTRVTLGIASFVRGQWLLIAAALIAGGVLFRQWRSTTSGRIAIDHIKLRVPLVGEILHRFGLAEFCRSLATLLSGGIPLVTAAEIAIGGVSNAYLRDRLGPSVDMVRQGQPFHRALEESRAFTDMSIDMIKVGEATGSLDDMLVAVSDFLDEQVEVRTQRLLNLVEPVLLVVMGLIIGILLISIYLPLFSVMTQIQG